MPETRDIAALPTSWALTIWDALPVFLSVELAVALLVVVLLGNQRRETIWRFTAALPLGAVVYLGLFNSGLALVLAGAAFGHGFAMRSLTPDVEPAPDSPWTAMKRRGGDVIWAVVIQSAVAALVKVILAPAIPSGSGFWILVGVAGGVLTPGPLGVAAIPALAVQSASDGIVPAVIWIAVAAVRLYVLAYFRTSRNASGHATGAS